jgi:hypothetical protein
MKKFNKQKYLEVLYCLLILGWSISSIVLSVLMLKKMKTLESNFESLLENWKSDIITDITTTYANSSEPPICDTGYESFLKYNWPGSNKFCLCTSGKTMSGNCCSRGS